MKKKNKNTNKSEAALDLLMEYCLKREYLVSMENTLRQCSRTYSNYGYYLEKLEKIKAAKND